MEGDNKQNKEPIAVPDSPKPMAFTIDFSGDKKVDVQRHKTLAEKFQNRHKRGQSLSKLEDSTTPPLPRSHPLTGNLPRKSSFQSEGYFSSDEKTERTKSAKSEQKSNNAKRTDLTLFLKNVTTDRMTQSFPNTALPCILSPDDFELKNISSPEFDLISPYSPKETAEEKIHSSSSKGNHEVKVQLCRSEVTDEPEDNVFVDGNEFDFDKISDTVSDAGTYTLDPENYSEEQKARMSIDKDFRIEEISVHKKTEEYVQSLATVTEDVLTPSPITETNKHVSEPEVLKSPFPPIKRQLNKVLSPILSPTQNLSITDTISQEKLLNNGHCEILNQTFTKTMVPSSMLRAEVHDKCVDQGTIISVTSSGAFRSKNEEKKKLERKWSLSKSEIHVEAYVDGKSYSDTSQRSPMKKLTTTIVNVQNIEVTHSDSSNSNNTSPVLPKFLNVCGLPPSVGGKVSPTKIPSPIHTMSRPRSGPTLEFSDGGLETTMILQPTQNYINTLQQKLSLDSDPDSDYDAKYGLQLNNTAHLLKQRASHTRHNSLDDRTMNNKLEHFQNKNLSGIDQTYSNLFSQYTQAKVIKKIHNSPNISPIRRSSSFSTKNHINVNPKNTNVNLPQKGSNLCSSPNLTNIHRSSSTVCIKPNFISSRRTSIGDHKKIDRSQFGDTESSSEDDFEKNLPKRKDLGNISNTRCNRAFSLRRARADSEVVPLKCPNTPEMRRKAFHTDVKQERAISVDRKPMKTTEVQSRYLSNVTKKGTPPPVTKETKNVPKTSSANLLNNTSRLTNKPQTFSRTDSGRFSMRTSSKPPLNNIPKSGKKDTGKNKQGGRSNSSLSSREVEFQNWKRRKSYDPMKAAAEGKKKELQKRQSLGTGSNAMTQSCFAQCNLSPDSSPSHSSSVHRSQSFHGTAALEQLISSDESEDLTLSADEGFSPPTPSPCELSPARASLRHTLWERLHH